MNEKEELRARVLNEIRNNANKLHPIKLSKLKDNVGLTTRVTKQIVSDLRNEYPIVAKETEGGGYWLAEDEADIVSFIQMMERRKNGYENTLHKMYLFLADYGNIPSII